MPNLSRLSDEMRAAFEQSITAKHAPAEVDEIEMLNEVFEAAMAAQSAAIGFTKSITNPAEVAKIERDAAASAAAGAAFDQSLQ